MIIHTNHTIVNSDFQEYIIPEDKKAATHRSARLPCLTILNCPLKTEIFEYVVIVQIIDAIA